MSGIDEVVDGLSGMITREQAKALLENGGVPQTPSEKTASRDVTDAAGVLKLIEVRRQGKAPRSSGSDAITVNLQDKIYRIFNPVYLGQDTRMERRSLVVGTEGYAIRINLSRLSSFMDAAAFERGDTVLVGNALLDLQNRELKEGKDTSIRRLFPTRHECTLDYSKLSAGMRNIDVMGKVVEVLPVKQVGSLRGASVAVAGCTLKGLNGSIGVSLWESSALAISNIRVNDAVKIEFCSVRARNGNVEICANGLSRVVASSAFAGRLGAQG
jgi:hypothetical protein